MVACSNRLTKCGQCGHVARSLQKATRTFAKSFSAVHFCWLTFLSRSCTETPETKTLKMPSMTMMRSQAQSRTMTRPTCHAPRRPTQCCPKRSLRLRAVYLGPDLTEAAEEHIDSDFYAILGVVSARVERNSRKTDMRAQSPTISPLFISHLLATS